MMKKTEDLFPVLNWILKKSKTINDNTKYPSTFILNRWLSMTTQFNALIVNQTINKWSFLYVDSGFVSKFLRVLLEKHVSKISYLKKKKNKNKPFDLEDNENIIRECSKREIFLQKKLIEELNTLAN